MGITGLLKDLTSAEMGPDRLIEPAQIDQHQAEVVPRLRFTPGLTDLVVQVAGVNVGVDRLIEPARPSQHHTEIGPYPCFAVGVTDRVGDPLGGT